MRYVGIFVPYMKRAKKKNISHYFYMQHLLNEENNEKGNKNYIIKNILYEEKYEWKCLPYMKKTMKWNMWDYCTLLEEECCDII